MCKPSPWVGEEVGWGRGKSECGRGVRPFEDLLSRLFVGPFTDTYKIGLSRQYIWQSLQSRAFGTLKFTTPGVVAIGFSIALRVIGYGRLKLSNAAQRKILE